MIAKGTAIIGKSCTDRPGKSERYRREEQNPQKVDVGFIGPCADRVRAPDKRDQRKHDGRQAHSPEDRQFRMAQDVGEISAGKQVPGGSRRAGRLRGRMDTPFPVDVRADRPRQQKADPCHDPFAAAFFEQDQQKRAAETHKRRRATRPGCKTGQQRRIE